MKKKSNKKIKTFYLPDSYSIYANCIVITKTHMLCAIITSKTATFIMPNIDDLPIFNYYPHIELLYYRNELGYNYYIYDIQITSNDEKDILDETKINEICTEIFGLKKSQIRQDKTKGETNEF